MKKKGKMRFMIIMLFFGMICPLCQAQQVIRGVVKNPKSKPVAYANIFLEGSYDGCITDSSGNFEFLTQRHGSQVLVCSFIGYRKSRIVLDLDTLRTPLQIGLDEEVSELNEVMITAGIFSASDKKKSATLSSFDIASTASAVGDIYGAYSTMPGSQKVGEEGKLFVRGGESYETRTYMDGMPVLSPYFSNMPDVPTRGRFSPLLFSETVFSTGGYSAEYGQALSSIVDLTTNGLESQNKASVSLMSVGGNASVSRRWDRSSLALSGLYTNSSLHHALFKQNVDWVRAPSLGDAMLMYRLRIREEGLLKSFVSSNRMSMCMDYDNFEAGTMDRLDIKNLNYYANTTYTDQLHEKWLIKGGLAFSQDRENLLYIDLPVRTLTSSLSARLVLTHLLNGKLKARLGLATEREWYRQTLVQAIPLRKELKDFLSSLFLEADWTITRSLALRSGIRMEYSSLCSEASLLPRISAALKTGTYSQLSLAWGKYRQKALNDYLKIAPGLQQERADHYILNFQYRQHKRTFRVEAYVKNYEGLVKYTHRNSTQADDFSNKGYGQARGVDVFWRDSESLKESDYWISYSYLNTSRDYQDYPCMVTPHFASAHNLALVYKRFITPIQTFTGITYSFASGRPYNDKNAPVFMNGKTKVYQDISISLTYLSQFLGKEFIIHLSLNNILASRNVFGYRFASTPDDNGIYPSQAVVPTNGMQAILMFMISL